jgi:Mrp family chromosome partitioning ATPase
LQAPPGEGTKVDGVVIVGRVGLSRRDAAERLQQILAGSGAPLLGVIEPGGLCCATVIACSTIRS